MSTASTACAIIMSRVLVLLNKKPLQLINTSINTFFGEFCTLLRNIEEQGRLLKDEKKLDSAVDEPSSEQRFHKSDVITFVV